MSSKTVTYESEYDGLPIMTNRAKGQGCNKDILKIIKAQFDHAERTKKKIFCMRYDARFPQDGNHPLSNEIFASFQADFIKTLKRKKKGCNPQYVVTREQSREKHQHYHGLLLLDGNKIQNINDPIKYAERIWQRKLNCSCEEGQIPNSGLIENCTKDRHGNFVGNGVMLRHDDPKRLSKLHGCFRRASYLAKSSQKGYAPQGQREVFASRIPKVKVQV